MKEVRWGYWLIGRESEKIMRKGGWREIITGKQYKGWRTEEEEEGTDLKEDYFEEGTAEGSIVGYCFRVLAVSCGDQG